VTAIAAGTAHSLALKGDGTVVAWGCRGFDYGQCTVPSGLSGVTAIAAGKYHSLALKGEGTIVAWGCGAGSDQNGECRVPSGLSRVTAIAAGLSHSLALVQPITCNVPKVVGKRVASAKLTIAKRHASGRGRRAERLGRFPRPGPHSSYASSSPSTSRSFGHGPKG
jgi:hypothetical protein